MTIDEYVTDWSVYAPYFTEEEFRCSHSGEVKVTKRFMNALLKVRIEYDKPMVITSGYRSEDHPVEARKSSPGFHTTGIACDVKCWSNEAFHIVAIAIKHGFTGIGVSQNSKSNARFVHLDMRNSPVLYSY